MNNDVTIISQLFYIKDQKDILKEKHSHFYKTWVKNLLSLNCPLIFYTDDYYYDFIYDERIKHDLNLEKTRIIKTTIDSLDCFIQYFEKIDKLLWSKEFRNLNFPKDGIQWNNTNYNIVTLNKLFLLKKYANFNIFNTNFFCWLDAGGIRHYILPNMKWPNISDNVNKNKFNLFSVVKDRHIISNKMHYCLSHAAMIQAAILISSQNPINLVYDEFIKELNICLNEGYIPTEQKVFDFCSINNPELFNIIYAGNINSKIENVWFKFFDYFTNQTL
jgi:hypothetical protein